MSPDHVDDVENREVDGLESTDGRDGAGGDDLVHLTTSLSLTASPPGFFGGFRCGVTHRRGGTSLPPYASLNLGRWVSDRAEAVAENERRLTEAVGLGAPARLRLEHGARIVAVSGPGLYGPADGLATFEEELPLQLTVADCYPVALMGPFPTAAAARAARVLVHCGWRGTASGILDRAVDWFGAQAIAPGALRAWVGPGIGACCYEVGPEVAERFPESATPWRAEGAAPASRLDLGAAILHRLRLAGLSDPTIRLAGGCTSCERAKFFSHRREGFPTGRMAAVFWRT